MASVITELRHSLPNWTPPTAVVKMRKAPLTPSPNPL